MVVAIKFLTSGNSQAGATLTTVRQTEGGRIYSCDSDVIICSSQWPIGHINIEVAQDVGRVIWEAHKRFTERMIKPVMSAGAHRKNYAYVVTAG